MKSVTIRERLAAADPKNAEAQRDLNSGYGKLVALVLADVSFARNLPAAQQVPTLVVALAILLTKNDPPKARQAAELLAELAKDADNYYSAARGFALLSASGDKEAREKDARRAVELFRQAVAKGFKNVAFIKQFQALDSLRDRDDFKQLLADLEKANPPKQ